MLLNEQSLEEEPHLVLWLPLTSPNMAHEKDLFPWGTWLAPLEEHMTLDLRVVNSNPVWGVRLLKNNILQKKKD